MSFHRLGLRKFKKTKLPFIVAKCAQTLDGKIATFSGDSKWISSAGSRKFARSQRSNFDAIMVGINTVLKDNPGLNGTNKAKVLKKIVLDASLKVSPRARLFQGMPAGSCIVATTEKAPGKKVKEFQRRGIVVIVCPQKNGRVNLRWLCQELVRNSVYAILLEGGATVIGGALKEKLVDQMHFYVAPSILGDRRGLSSVVGRNIKSIRQAISLKIRGVKKITTDLLITADVLRNS
ncbi:MAG TPA: RibD family protein [Candidatus Omnitrophota bacterium]|nr:RibD family protein [Candidatus Omnitrophota bacterium]